MPTKRKIEVEIDIELYDAIMFERKNKNESFNEVLKRVFTIEKNKTKETITPISTSQSGGLLTRGTLLPNGLKLRKLRRGTYHYAEVKNNFIMVNEKAFTSTSKAANEISNNSVNGWIFWEYQAEDGTWKILKELRRK